eukprot:Nk52_evm1s302 gene=Nk52_evmTU1s302
MFIHFLLLLFLPQYLQEEQYVVQMVADDKSTSLLLYSFPYRTKKATSNITFVREYKCSSGIVTVPNVWGDNITTKMETFRDITGYLSRYTPLLFDSCAGAVGKTLSEKVGSLIKMHQPELVLTSNSEYMRNLGKKMPAVAKSLRKEIVKYFTEFKYSDNRPLFHIAAALARMYENIGFIESKEQVAVGTWVALNDEWFPREEISDVFAQLGIQSHNGTNPEKPNEHELHAPKNTPSQNILIWEAGRKMVRVTSVIAGNGTESGGQPHEIELYGKKYQLNAHSVQLPNREDILEEIFNFIVAQADDSGDNKWYDPNTSTVTHPCLVNEHVPEEYKEDPRIRVVGGYTEDDNSYQTCKDIINTVLFKNAPYPDADSKNFVGFGPLDAYLTLPAMFNSEGGISLTDHAVQDDMKCTPAQAEQDPYRCLYLIVSDVVLSHFAVGRISAGANGNSVWGKGTLVEDSKNFRVTFYSDVLRELNALQYATPKSNDQPDVPVNNSVLDFLKGLQKS